MEHSSGRLDISVKEKPKDGAANERVLQLVARHLGVARKKVRIVRGHTAPSKLIEVI